MRQIADFVLVHGSGVDPLNPGMPSPVTARNADEAAKLVTAGNVNWVVTTGLGPLGNEISSEADAAGNYLVRHCGINPDVVFRFSGSTSTLGNQIGGIARMGDLGSSWIGVCRETQLPRAKRLGKAVATATKTELVRYIGSPEASLGLLHLAKAYGRELFQDTFLTKPFLRGCEGMSPDEMLEFYDRIKRRSGASVAKAAIHGTRRAKHNLSGWRSGIGRSPAGLEASTSASDNQVR